MGKLTVILLTLIVVAAVGVLGGGIIMLLWNALVPFFGGPMIPFKVAYAIYWVLLFIGSTFRTR